MPAASLPMYDLPELRPAMAALWAGIARALGRQGVTDVPAALIHDVPADELWPAPDLLLSQCCGYDLLHGAARGLRPLATPRYRAPGCAGSNYLSIVVVAEASGARRVEDLRGTVCAINSRCSHSGMNALRALVAPLSRDGRFFGAVEVSGAHAASLAMVASRTADVAAIDGVTYALLARHRPAALTGTRPLCRTASAPAPPFVTRADLPDELVLRLRGALHDALADPGLATARDALLLDGLEILPLPAYARLEAFERLATRHGYPELP